MGFIVRGGKAETDESVRLNDEGHETRGAAERPIVPDTSLIASSDVIASVSAIASSS